MFKLPELPYSYDAFGENFSSNLMELHHSKHHQAYVNKLNDTLAGYPDLQTKTVEELVRSYKTLPGEIQTKVRNFGGGHLNHSIFWQILSPTSSMKPSGRLAEAIAVKYGSVDKMIEEFNASAMSLFGSGWTWLLADLSIVNTSNQDNPMTDGLAPAVVCVDVWEHAYYPDYTFKRADFLEAFWKSINWEEASKRYEEFNK